LELAPAGGVEVSSGIDTTNFVPGNQMTNAGSDGEMAVRANPRLVFIGVLAHGWLDRVSNTAFEFGAS
jgi:hypothetical protein